MKKLLSIVMALIMVATSVFSTAITASAGVYYDTEKLTDTSTYKALTISGKNHYKYAFDCLVKLNAIRTKQGAAKLKMDADLLEAAMLRAHELVVRYALERPNGEPTEFIVDSNSNQIAYMMFCKSTTPNYGAAVAEYFCAMDSENIIAYNTEIKSAGVGAFESEETGYTYWVLFVSVDAPKKTVAASSYSTSKSKSEKIALYKDYVSEWSKTHKHTYVNSTVVTPASATAKTNGKMKQKCKTCGATRTVTVYYPKTITLSTTSYTYNGKVKKPSVTVKDAKGNKISSSYYTVSYASGRKSVGRYSVKVTFKGKYKGTVTKYFLIKPQNTSITSLTAGKKKFTVKIKKYTTQTTGNQIQYSTSSKFTSAKTLNTKNTTTAKTIGSLKSGKKYYVRIRTYKTVKINGKATKLYSSWSKAKTVKVK